MMRLHWDVFSDSIEQATSVEVLLPSLGAGQIGVSTAGSREGATPVLYLLHGLTDDASAWTRNTSIERYADALGIAVVMPQVGRSFYQDLPSGERYFAWVAEELPQLVARTFRISSARENNFVAGLSMGGYGAFRLALAHPERYAAAASLSGALDVATIASRPERAGLVRGAFGDEPQAVRGSAADLFALLDCADPASLPALWLTCGTEDELVGANHAFVDAAATAGAALAADFPPGEHEWGFWDTHIQRVLDWLPVRR